MQVLLLHHITDVFLALSKAETTIALYTLVLFYALNIVLLDRKDMCRCVTSTGHPGGSRKEISFFPWMCGERIVSELIGVNL